MPIVLVVDDEMLIRWAVAESLSTAGFGVVEAGSACEALERFADAAGTIAVALLDLRSPTRMISACCGESRSWRQQS